MILLLLVALCLSPVTARGQKEPKVKFDANGHVLEVRDTTHVVVNRGRAEALAGDARDLPFYSVRNKPDSRFIDADTTLRLALGRVVHLEEHTATLELASLSGIPRVGDVFANTMEVSASLADDPLFAPGATDVLLRFKDSERPIYTVSDLLANPSPSFREAERKYRIGYLSSATFRRALQDRRSAPLNLLGFADPDGSLPSAREEFREVREKGFPQAKVLVEKDATKQNFFELALNYPIIHFATHGTLSLDSTASYLTLYKDRLTVHEIAGFARLKGHTDLVVLSVCDTAIERRRSTGEELISIARAFTLAGAPAIVATLWKVDDDATREVMTRFYVSLHDSAHTDKLEALRQAQLALLHFEKEGKHPYAAPFHWAALELIGDFR